MSKNTIIPIKSAFRTNGTTDNFMLQLPTTHYFNRMELIYAAIPNSYYTVSSTNNTIYFIESVSPGSGTLQTATIASGFYDITTYPTAVQTAINAVAAQAVTVTYSSVTGMLTITAGVGRVIRFLFATNTTNSAAYQMGFYATDTAFANAATSPYVVDLSSHQDLYVSIGGTSQPIASSNLTSTFFATFVVPTGVTSGGFNIYNSNNNFDQYSETKSIQTFTVTIRDAANNQISLNGANCTFLVRLC